MSNVRSDDAPLLPGEQCGDVWCEGEPGWLDHDEDAIWAFEEVPLTQFKIADGALTDPASWIEWFDSEVQAFIKDGMAYRADDMHSMVIKINEPIVALAREEDLYLWGGHHRLSASFKAGRTTIRCLVGRLKTTNQG